MATSKIPKVVRQVYETYIVTKRGTAGLFPANGAGTFLASAIGVQPDAISGYTLMGTLLSTNATGCIANYSEDGTVNWQNITSTPQNDVQIIATHFYLRQV